MPPVKLADRARRIAPSATMAVDAKAKEMQRAGINVVSFGAGEPDFPTPPHVKEAASRVPARGRLAKALLSEWLRKRRVISSS